jgi:chromosome segregation ATPase
MMSPDTAAALAHDEETLRLLEAELEKTTERSRLAKQAVKDAKAAAKAAKRDKRRARKALVAAQEAYVELLAAAEKAVPTEPLRTSTRRKPKSSTEPDTKRRIAGSPEEKRSRKRKPVQAAAKPPAPEPGGIVDSPATDSE